MSDATRLFRLNELSTLYEKYKYSDTNILIHIEIFLILNRTMTSIRTDQLPHSPRPPRPTIPSYDATREEIAEFLMKYFGRSLSLSRDKSLEHAKKFPVDGEALYLASEQQLTDVYGVPGKVLFYDVQRSKYGRVCFHPPLLPALPNDYSPVLQCLALCAIGCRCCHHNHYSLHGSRTLARHK